MYKRQILKHANINLENIPGFIEKLKKISEDYKIEFYVSVSARTEELTDVNMEGCKILN